MHLTEQKGIEKGKAEEVKNLIEKLGLNDEQAANVAGISVQFVQQVRKNIAIG